MAVPVKRGAIRGETDSRAVPVELYEQARRLLLVNAPLLGPGGREGIRASALTAAEIDVLESVGMSTAPWVSGPKHDPLISSIADYMALLETSFTTGQAAKFLKVDVSRIRQRLRERSLFGIEYDGDRLLPRFQFERQRALPGLREVIGALPENLNPLDVAEWFLSPNPDLEFSDQDAPLSPRDWLLRGKSTAAIVALAQGFE